MKKLIILSIMVLGLVAFSVPSADATYCINLAGFCDRMEVDLDASGNVYGHWDVWCDDSFYKPILGAKNGSKLDIVGDLTVEMGLMWIYRFNIPKPNRLWSSYYYDGVNPPVLLHLNQPWTVTGGACPPLGLDGAAQLPKSTD